jgi:hypothetical protein
VCGVGMDERHLEAKQPTMWFEVDQLHACVLEPPQLAAKVADFVRHVVHARAALGDEPAHVRVGTERAQELDAAPAHPDGGSLHTLVGHRLTLLELGTEDAPVRLDRFVEVFDRHPQMMNPFRLHREADGND